MAYVSPLGSGGYPTLEPIAPARRPACRIRTPSWARRKSAKHDDDRLCRKDSSTPTRASRPTRLPEHAELCALTNSRQPASQRKANHDVTTVRVATTNGRHQFHRHRHPRRPPENRPAPPSMPSDGSAAAAWSALSNSRYYGLFFGRRQLPRQQFRRLPFHRLCRAATAVNSPYGPAQLGRSSMASTIRSCRPTPFPTP